MRESIADILREFIKNITALRYLHYFFQNEIDLSFSFKNDTQSKSPVKCLFDHFVIKQVDPFPI